MIRDLASLPQVPVVRQFLCTSVASRKGNDVPLAMNSSRMSFLMTQRENLRAQNVMFSGVSQPFIRTKRRHASNPFIAFLLLAALGITAWQHLSSGRVRNISSVVVEDTAHFQCQGKRYCSEMTSCEEATFYLKNCPGVEIDGDGDGIPCESQWCGH